MRIVWSIQFGASAANLLSNIELIYRGWMRSPFSRRSEEHAVKYWILLLLFVIPCGAFAQIYKWTDKNGQVHYSQTPPPGQAAGAIDFRESQSGQAPPPKPVEAPASAASKPAPVASAAAPKKKVLPEPPKSLSGGKSDESDEARCNFARDILSGAVKRAGRRGPVDDDDRAMATNDVRMFCR